MIGPAEAAPPGALTEALPSRKAGTDHGTVAVSGHSHGNSGRIPFGKARKSRSGRCRGAQPPPEHMDPLRHRISGTQRQQNVEKVRQPGTRLTGDRVAQRLNVLDPLPREEQRVPRGRLASSLAACLCSGRQAAALDGLFEHPAGPSDRMCDLLSFRVSRVSK
jgi:hypothetical protein